MRYNKCYIVRKIDFRYTVGPAKRLRQQQSVTVKLPEHFRVQHPPTIMWLNRFCYAKTQIFKQHNNNNYNNNMFYRFGRDGTCFGFRSHRLLNNNND